MELIQMVSQMGFPIAVAAWLLINLEARMDSAEGAARKLATKIQAHMDWCMKCQRAVCGNQCENKKGR